MDDFPEIDGSGSWVRLSFTLNGEDVEIVVPADRRLVEVLRDDLGLTGTKLACEVGVCGACTVLVDDQPRSGCLTLAVQVDGQRVLTIEGANRLSAVQAFQEALIEEGGVQCGFCTSGQILGLTPLLLAERSAPSRAEIAEEVDGNLCRCTGYYGIVRAVERVLR